MGNREQVLAALLKKYYVNPKVFPKNFKVNPVPKHNVVLETQTAENCRLFSNLNHMKLTKTYPINIQGIIQYYQSFGLQTEKFGSIGMLGAIICDYYKDKDYCVYGLDILANERLFSAMLKAGRWFMYSRDCSNAVLQDILDNDTIDSIHKGITSPHAVNIGFIPNGGLEEEGNRGEDNVYNNFKYKTPQLFIQLIKSGMIDPVVFFIDKRQ